MLNILIIVMPMYNLIEYSDNYSKTSGILWKYCKEIPAVDDASNIVDFNGANATDSYNFKTKIADQTGDDGRINNAEIMVSVKYLSNLQRTLEIPLINCEVELILTWSANSVIIYTDVPDQVPTFEITETNLYVLAVTLSTQDKAKLLPRLKSGFKGTTSWNKYLSKPELLPKDQKLNNLIEPNFQGINRLFVLAFKNYAQRISNKSSYISNVEIKDVMIDGKNFFDQLVKNNKVKYENIRKVATDQRDD